MNTTEKDMPVLNSNLSHTERNLPLPQHFSYSEILYYLNRSALECLHEVEEERIYKLLYIKEQPFPVEICYEKGTHNLVIRSLRTKPVSNEEWELIHLYIEEWLDLQTDLAPFYRIADNDPMLSPLVDSLRGLRIVGVPDLFEALCWAVIGQQINLTFAYTLKKRLVENFGETYEFDGRTYHRFPSPSALLADNTVNTLRELQFTSKKAEYIVDIAGRVVRGELQKEALLASGYQAAEETLLRIRGIGPWSAHYVMMRSLRNPAAFPAGDAGLHAALKKQLGLTVKPTPAEIIATFEPWQGYEAYAVFYLWRSLTL
ncbi:DNA-3-methyladenine glycosylase 2 [Paenibacillus sp. Marseille-Q4541]|uniref:DNA-3-methyladenine glycosylase 2 n=1 Tax=Paenibacillus sp. Marseille-Q4541 TaxID=2831522 RepID=UPI001BAB8BA3|nr:DNA-3-methyladenine glycosylase 2 [Paenibacillus sp. Marseille-Q4541]